MYDAGVSITADSVMFDNEVYEVVVYPSGGELYLDGVMIATEDDRAAIDASRYAPGGHELRYAGNWGEFDCYFFETKAFTIQHVDGITEMERAVSVWPNPVSGTLNIECGGSRFQSIRIIDMTGRTVLWTEGCEGAATVDVSGLCPGVYFLRLDGGYGTVTKKFVKR